MIMEEYDLPESKEITINTATNAAVDNVNLKPFDKIKIASEKFGLAIQEPKSNCRRCYGRGYLGVQVDPLVKDDGGNPIPCPCIYPKPKDDFEKMQRETAQQMYAAKNLNRVQRRQQQKMLRKKGI